MNISVFKDNQSVVEVNLSAEILGNLDSDATFFVGRSPDCHVHLDDKQISREHAELSFVSGAWNIKQLSPFSKVIINGTPYENKVLVSGDIVTVGPYILNINIPEISEVESVEENAQEAIPIEDPESDLTDDLPDETEMLDDFDEETVALDAEQVSELGEDISEDDDFSSGEIEDFDSGEDEFSSESTDDESFEADIEDIDTSSDEDELFGDSEEVETSFEDGGDDDYAMESYDDDEDDPGESTRVIQAFAKIELELFGEYAPYEKYVIDTAEVRIGRDPEKCQIVLNDAEVSGVHAVLKKNNITCLIEDLDSGNGTLLNGERINKSVLTNHDEIVIGGTTLTVKISSDFLQEEEKRLMPVEENQSVEVEEIIEVSADFDDELGEVAEGTTKSQGLVADLKNFKNLPPELRKKYLIYGVVLITVGLFLFSDEETKKKAPKKTTTKSNLLYKKDNPNTKKKKLLKKLTPEQIEYVESQYLLAKEQFEVGNYRDAVTVFDKIFVLIEEYKSATQLYQLSKDGLKKLEEQEKKRKEEIARKLRNEKVKKLVEIAKEAVDQDQIIRARSTFDSILGLDPENFDVPILKQRIEDFERKQQAEAVRKAEIESERKRQVDLLSPGKSFYLNKEWYKAVQKLKDFVRKRNIDEDLMSEGSKMLSESKDKLSNIVGPLLGKARSLKEGQDLKGAYEIYLEIMNSDPSNAEALDESNEIRERLKNRSKKIYREAIIAESLSLFEDAKEKFQEVQQVSPSDSEYYKKASEKLKDYLD